MLDMARAFARRLEQEVGKQQVDLQVERGYRLAFGRPPAKAEKDAAVVLVSQHGLMVFCRALLNANELIYVH